MDNQPASRGVRLLSELGLVYAAVIWGSTFFIVKWTIGYVDPVALVAYRFLLATALMLIWLVAAKKSIFRAFKPGFVLGLLLGLLYIAQTSGLAYTTASNSGFITGMFIIFVPLCTWLLFRRGPRVNHIVAVAIAAIGLWLLTGGVSGINTGDLITLASAVTYALHVILAGEYMRRGADPVVLNFQQTLVTALFALITMGALGRPWAVSLAEAWWAIAFLALFPTLSAFAVQLYAQRVVNPVRTSLIFTLEPVCAAIFAWTLGGEGFIAARAAGGLLIVAAMLVSEVEYRRRGTQPATSSGHG